LDSRSESVLSQKALRAIILIDGHPVANLVEILELRWENLKRLLTGEEAMGFEITED
jgi:hypothetical protein